MKGTMHNLYQELRGKAQKSMANQKKYLHDNWAFRQVGKNEWANALVPGNNFSDLLSNNLIGHPFYRDNEDKLQWIEKEDWEYKQVFVLTRDEFLYSNIELVFEGLDTYAEVRLNGQLILFANNMFCEWRTNVKKYLDVGSNTLTVLFKSPIKYVQERAKDAGLTYPAGNDHSDEKLSVFTRKAPYHYGWDWGPTFVCSGIWRPVYLHFYDAISITDCHITTNIASGACANVVFDMELDAIKEVEAFVQIDCENATIPSILQSITLAPGNNNISLMMAIPNIKRWWPRGMGEPFLYELRIKLLINGSTIATLLKKVGIRTIEVVNGHDGAGGPFYFVVNEKPVFAKGANYIPQDSFLTTVSKERYLKLFDDIVKSNMNMVRVWGGGIYEDSLFYELADELGILIWQDFMFACTMYPGDREFLDSVEEEAVYNIKRLRNHASLALWCGNNEIAVGWENWGWEKEFDYNEKQQAQLEEDYHSLFHELLPKVVKGHDPGRFYFPSSPMGDYENEGSYSEGDVHYWGVWHGEAPFSEFKKKIPRFMSEFGFQSFPVLKSVKKYSLETDWDIESPVMKLHQKHSRGNGLIKKYMLQHYRQPKDFGAFLYLSQVLQAGGIKMAIEAHRRAQPYCMGTLYWQLNDCWPVASWSGIDYYGTWKALQYAVKKCYAPVMISVEGRDGEFEVYVVSEYQVPTTLELKVTIMDFDGRELGGHECDVQANIEKPTVMVINELKGIVASVDTKATLAHFILREEGNLVAEQLAYFEEVKDLELPEVKVKKGVWLHEGKIVVELSSEALAKDIYVWSDSIDENFSDNFFDLLPGEIKTIEASYYNDEIPEINIVSVVDTY